MGRLRLLVFPGLPAAILGVTMGGASFVPYGIAFVVLLLLMLGGHQLRRSAASNLLESQHERPYLATLKRAEETGPWVNDIPALALTLEFQSERGPTSLTAKERPSNFHLTVPHLTPGAHLPIYADIDEGKARVDWAAWNDARERQAPIEAPPSLNEPALPRPSPSEDGTRLHPIHLRVAGSLCLAAASISVAFLGYATLSAGGQSSVLGEALGGLDPRATSGIAVAAFAIGVGVIFHVILGFFGGDIPVVHLPDAANRYAGRATGTVEASARRGRYLQKVCVELRVAFEHEGRPRKTQMMVALPDAWSHVALDGRTLPIQYEPQDPRRVAIDWESAGAPT